MSLNQRIFSGRQSWQHAHTQLLFPFLSFLISLCLPFVASFVCGFLLIYLFLFHHRLGKQSILSTYLCVCVWISARAVICCKLFKSSLLLISVFFVTHFTFVAVFVAYIHSLFLIVLFRKPLTYKQRTACSLLRRCMGLQQKSQINFFHHSLKVSHTSTCSLKIHKRCIWMRTESGFFALSSFV